MNRKQGRSKRRRLGRLLPLTLKERTKRTERRIRNKKLTGAAKVTAKSTRRKSL